jgi:beta-glucanase (GH16 family)
VPVRAGVDAVGEPADQVQQGYFEARMRWTQGQGAWPAFWLYSWRHLNNPDYFNINSYCADNSPCGG